LPQATGNAVISYIHPAHKKYESNPLDWQRVLEIGWHLMTKQDMERFEEMCENGLLGPRDYGLFEDWSAIDRLRDGYICIRDGFVLEVRFRRWMARRTFMTRGHTRPVFVDFSWHTTRCLLIVGGSGSIRRTWSVIVSSR
jgi:hypothetical protein